MDQDSGRRGIERRERPREIGDDPVRPSRADSNPPYAPHTRGYTLREHTVNFRKEGFPIQARLILVTI